MWSSHKLTAVTSSVVTFCCFIDTCNHTLVLRFCLVYTTPRCPSCASGKTLGSNLLIMRTRVPLNTNCPMTQSSLATILYCLQLSKSVSHRWVRFLSSRQCVWGCLHRHKSHVLLCTMLIGGCFCVLAY